MYGRLWKTRKALSFVLDSVRSRIGYLLIRTCAANPNPRCLGAMRRVNRIQLTPDELSAVIAVIKEKGCEAKLLVFGCGNDSAFWTRLNHKGTTVFLEDNPSWLRRVIHRFPDLVAYVVRYDTRLSDWRESIEAPVPPTIDLPLEIAQEQWDVILVDAPAGWTPESPGRLQSIATARKVVSMPGHVFVHDCDREAENLISTRLLSDTNLIKQVGRLRHYLIRA